VRMLRSLAVDGLAIAIGSGQYCEVPDTDRISVLDVGSSRPSPLWDGHVATSDRHAVIADLRRRAAGVRIVELDTMARTRWRLMWTIDGGNFVAWDRLGVRLRVDRATIHRRGHTGVPAAAARAVVATLSDGWLTRGVEIRLDPGGVIAVTRQREIFCGAYG
jgi:hypothetical protein